VILAVKSDHNKEKNTAAAWCKDADGYPNLRWQEIATFCGPVRRVSFFPTKKAEV